MRRLSCFLIILAISLLSGCTDPHTNIQNVTFYYVHNDIVFGTESGVIASTQIQVTGNNTDYQKLLEKYFRGPTNYDCTSPFPAGITLEEFNMDANKVQILLSPHMSTLSGIQFTIACACLTRTVLEMTGSQSVQIRIQDNLIYGQESVTFNLSSFSYWDKTDQN